jgi:hypothetical protein
VKPSLWPVIAILAGMGLLAASLLAASLAPGRAAWTEEEAEELSNASAEFHAAAHDLPQSEDAGTVRGGKRPGYDPVAAKDRHEAAKQAFEVQTARLAAAQSHGVRLAWALRLSGILLAAIGVGGYAWSKASRGA